MKSKHRMRTLVVAVVAVLALVGAACGADDSASDDRLTIVATTTIWGEVAQQIVGDEANVEILMPVGADPHAYEASSQQVASIQEADLVVANGLGLEEGLRDVLEAAAGDGVNVFEVAPMLNPIPFAGGDDDGHEEDADDDEDEGEHDGDADHEEGEGHEHDRGGDDPHVWMDPDRVAVAAALISDELLELDADGPWKDRANDYISLLVGLDEHLAKEFGALSADGRTMVTSHQSFGYFAERYSFEIVGVVIPGGSTLRDPSSQELADLVNTMEMEGVNVIYAETTEPSALVDAVAAELGEDVAVVELYTGSIGEASNGTDTYIGMMRENARRIVEANS